MALYKGVFSVQAKRQALNLTNGLRRARLEILFLSWAGVRGSLRLLPPDQAQRLVDVWAHWRRSGQTFW